MTLTHRAVTSGIKGISRLLCRIDGDSLLQVPQQGPLILVCNHINFLEIPLVYSHLQPRPVTGFAKVETWDNPLLAPLFDLWEAIPIQRGAVDRDALQQGLEALEQGKILAISPEGTRSGTGQLKRGHPGVALIALMSGAPLLPLVYYGGETFRRNVRRLQRTDFRIRVGRPFHVRLCGAKSNRLVRQAITDEIMYQLALLLPPEYRGAYADLQRATTEFLEFG
jgi:1-acyl-sn-glycerol-3-phosphate acyltransferase